MKLHINATRMELLRLRKRLGIAVRGHKLLNDKLEGLMKEFLSLLKKYKEQRILVDKELPGILKLFVLSYISSSRSGVMIALEQSKTEYKYTLKQRRILNVPIPFFSVTKDQIIEGKGLINNMDNTISYSLVDTNSELDNAITSLKDLLPDIIKLAELEHSARVVAREINKTRKRVNALEYGIIPQMKENLRFIVNRLDEIERSNISRIMKIKDILEKP